jgi:hypothetical protein
MEEKQKYRSLTIRFREGLIQEVQRVSRIEEVSASDVIRKAVKEYVNGK